MSKKHQVTKGRLTGTGRTITEAKIDLERQLEHACDHTAAHIEFRYGLTLIVSASSQGWEYTIVSPEHIQHGQARYSCCAMAWGATQRETIQAARAHACQWSWSHDVDDVKHVLIAGCDETEQRQLLSLFKGYRNQKQAA